MFLEIIDKSSEIVFYVSYIHCRTMYSFFCDSLIQIAWRKC